MMTLEARSVTDEIMLAAIISGRSLAAATLKSSTTLMYTALSAVLSAPVLSLLSHYEGKVVVGVLIGALKLLGVNMTPGGFTLVSLLLGCRVVLVVLVVSVFLVWCLSGFVEVLLCLPCLLKNNYIRYNYLE